MTHGLEKEAGDVCEKRAVALANASLSDEREKLGHDAAEFFAGAEIGAAGEQLIRDGLGFGVIDFFELALVDDAQLVGVAVVRISATASVS
jgi:hypothetical protein